MAKKKEKKSKKKEAECNDQKCPIHSNVGLRGYKFKAAVVSDKMKNSAVVQRPYVKKIPKFERYERRNTRISVHNPPCIDAKEGDEVIVQKCRPLSKTKNFAIVEKVE